MNWCKLNTVTGTRDFYNAYYNTGELFTEYLEKECINKDGKLCYFCQAHDWVGPKPGKNTSASSRSQQPCHYMKPFETQRVEDFRMTGSPELILNKSFDRFATKFAVDLKLVKE